MNVAAASNLILPLDSIVQNYQQKHETQINVNYAATGILLNQIRHNAPYDLVLLADSALVANHFPTKEHAVLAYGVLALWKKDSLTTWQNAKRAAWADAELAPFGNLAGAYLADEKPRFSGQKIVANSISQVNKYIFLQAVDLALTANSGKRSIGIWQTLPRYQLPQTAVLLNQNNQAAAEFYRFLNSSVAAAIFTHFGYETR